jgi:ring-1,2-phenylacetyl-CoA epoxidase subunit PaaD
VSTSVTADSETRLAQAARLLATVTDPEIPVVSLDEMGIVRGVFEEADGGIRVVITPTYSGCPAMTQIEDDIRAVLQPLGQKITVQTQLSPAWTTDWMTSTAKEKLRAYGIAPPSRVCGSAAAQPQVVQFIRDAAVVDAVDCPHCGSAQTVEASHFGSTPCKALYKCLSCQEPFDYFKPF